MEDNIETTEKRSLKIKKWLAGLGLSVTVISGAVTGGYYLAPKAENNLNGIEFTDNEYNQLKIEITNSITNRKTKKATFSEMQVWIMIVNKEIKKCGRFELKNVNRDNFIDRVNALIISNKCG